MQLDQASLSLPSREDYITNTSSAQAVSFFHASYLFNQNSPSCMSGTVAKNAFLERKSFFSDSVCPPWHFPIKRAFFLTTVTERSLKADCRGHMKHLDKLCCCELYKENFTDSKITSKAFRNPSVCECLFVALIQNTCEWRLGEAFDATIKIVEM